jgi:hypothetical protein
MGQRCVIWRRCARGALTLVQRRAELGSGEDEPVVVERDLAREPFRAGLGADQNHHRSGRERLTLMVVDVSP